MRKLNFILAAVAFLFCLVSIYYGAAIHNANTNFHIEHLNEMDNIHYYNVEEVPFLTFSASFITAPFVLAILIMEIIVFRKAPVLQVKKIATALSILFAALFIFDAVIFFNPHTFDFSKWGFVFIFSGFFVITGNILSAYIKGNRKTSKPIATNED